MTYYIVALAIIVAIASNYIAGTIRASTAVTVAAIRELHTAVAICSDEIRDRLPEDPDKVVSAINNVEEKLRQMADVMPTKWDVESKERI